MKRYQLFWKFSIMTSLNKNFITQILEQLFFSIFTQLLELNTITQWLSLTETNVIIIGNVYILNNQTRRWIEILSTHQRWIWTLIKNQRFAIGIIYSIFTGLAKQIFVEFNRKWRRWWLHCSCFGWRRTKFLFYTFDYYQKVIQLHVKIDWQVN